MIDGPLTLAGLLDEAATEAGVEGERGADGATAWNGVVGPFAILSADGRSVEFRLDPTLADAAVRTPDTVSSERGSAWVTFAPRELDGPAVDRLRAWFAAAARRSGE